MSAEPPPPQVSPDGRFYWDGDSWVPLERPRETAMSNVPDSSSSNVGQLSADGHWWWNGQTWIPAAQVHGESTPSTPAIAPRNVHPRESSIWAGVLALLLSAVQAPLAIIFTFGLIGLAILWATTGSLGNALLFDLYFFLWSAGAMLPIVLAYSLGSVLRMITWTEQTDSVASLTTGVAGFGCFLIGVDLFLLGWSRFDGFTYWLGWVVIALFVLTYLGGFVSGWTGAFRKLAE